MCCVLLYVIWKSALDINHFCMCASLFFFFKQKTAYEMRISDWSSDVCSSDLRRPGEDRHLHQAHAGCTHLDDGGDEVDAGQQRADTGDLQRPDVVIDRKSVV